MAPATGTDNGAGPDSADEVFTVQPALLRDILEALDVGDGAAVVAAVDELHAADLADLIDNLPRDRRPDFVRAIGDALDPDVLIELEGTVLEEVILALSPTFLAGAIATHDTDDAVYLLEALEDEDQRDAVLGALPAPDRTFILQGLAYPEDSAGRLMQRDFVAVPAFWTVGQMIDHCREAEDLPEEFYEIFVVDPLYRPIGHVPLNRTLRAKRPELMRQIMDEDLRIIATETDQEEVAYMFRQYRLASAPVVDAAGRMVGVITFDDAAEVIEEEAEEDMMRLSGVSSDTDLFDPAVRTARTRFTWLLVNLGTAILASVVIALFEATIEKLVALAVLMPIVASMGGNAGTQTLTVAVRALATHDLTATNALRIVWKEIGVGGINGVIFAVLIGIIGAWWFANPMLGGVIAIAMVINMLVAGLFGTLIPLACDRFSIDPAVAGGILLTTITDVVGFFAFLGLAALVLL